MKSERKYEKKKKVINITTIFVSKGICCPCFGEKQEFLKQKKTIELEHLH